MNISVFEKYKVKFKNKYSYISDYDYDLNESIFSEETEKWQKTLSGDKLMELISKLLLEVNTISITETVNTDKQSNIVYIEKYNIDGTGATIIIEYQLVTK